MSEDEDGRAWPAGAAGFNSSGEPLLPIRFGGTPYGAVRDVADIISGLDISSEDAETLITAIGNALRINTQVAAFFAPKNEASSQRKRGAPGHVETDTALLRQAEFRKKAALRWKDFKPLVAEAAGYGETDDFTIHRRLSDRYKAMVAAGSSTFSGQ